MPSPTAIDFYLYTSHEIDTWLPIVQRLREIGADARFVLEPQGRNLARGAISDAATGWHASKEGRKESLVDEATYSRLLARLQAVGEQPLARRRRAAEAAVTTQGSRWLRVYSGTHVRTMYGVGLLCDAYGHGAVNHGFDVVLAHGKYSLEEIARTEPTVEVVLAGYPKWAAYRRGEIDTQAVRTSLDLDSRPVVLWVPTWAHASSLDEYLGPLASICASHQVFLKPHNNSVRFEQDRLNRAGSAGLTVVPETASLVDLMAVCDVVVADPRSGSFTEAILADRPIVGAFASDDRVEHFHPAVSACATVCRSPAEVVSAIVDAEQDPHRSKRREWAPQLFENLNGNDDRVAAQVILERATHHPSRRLTSLFWSAAYAVARRVGR